MQLLLKRLSLKSEKSAVNQYGINSFGAMDRSSRNQSLNNEPIQLILNSHLHAKQPLTDINHNNNKNLTHGESSSSVNGSSNFNYNAKSNALENFSMGTSSYLDFPAISSATNGIKEESSDDDDEIEEIGQVINNKGTTNGVKTEEDAVPKEEVGILLSTVNLN